MRKIENKVIEKQLPRKVKETSLGTECAVCGSVVRVRDCARFNYCPYCGQRIDWEV